VPGARPQALYLGAGAAGQPGTLARTPLPGPRQSFVDAPARTAEELVAGETAADPNRLAYLTPPLERAVRLSGTPRVTLRASLDGRSPYLTALLVDYGAAVRYQSLRVLDTLDCVAPGIPEDPGCFRQREYVTAETPLKIVSRGWLDVRNRLSSSRSVPIVPGRTYPVSWSLQPQDHVFAAGHRIGIVVISTDRDYTLRYRAGTNVSVALGSSQAILPLAPTPTP
jgi:X-Pro dipeptidyl-peptidase